MKETRIEKVTFAVVAASSHAFTAAAIGGVFCILLLSASLMAPPAFAQSSAAVRLEGGIAKEDVDGDLKSAMAIYEKIAGDRSAPREVRSKALLRLAGCYEKLGGQAKQVYEQLLRDFADQPAATQARTRLAALRQADRAAVPVTMTLRKIEIPFPTGFSEGQRAIYLDNATGALMIGDLASKENRVVLKPKAGGRFTGYMVSRDLSMAAVVLGQSGVIALIKTDGTGYREAGFETSPRCEPEFSWDNRYFFVCAIEPGGAVRLMKISAASGEFSKVGTTDLKAIPAPRPRPSPDGRFIAIGTWGGVPASSARLFIMPSEGGEPQLLADKARLIDWTRDGRYLIMARESSGAEALYLLPMKDGRADGEPIFVRYGPCSYGNTVADGALLCWSDVPGGGQTAWLGTLDSAGRLSAWKTLELGGARVSTSLSVRWSPDGSQIFYAAPDGAPGQDNWIVHVRNIATGEDRELYRGARTQCTWASQHASLFCSQHTAEERVLSIATDSGHVEQLGSVPGYSTDTLANIYFAGDDDRAIYLGRGDELIRWDIGARQATVLEHVPELRSGAIVPFPTRHWIAHTMNGSVEIRPTEGGDWKPIISSHPRRMLFTADGKWILYRETDAAEKQSLFRISTAGGKPERIGDYPGDSRSGFFWISPDGKTVIAQGRSTPETWLLENFEPKAPPAR
jgi:Tol biopolymer transport system component